jgi:hypothetical protein
MRRVRTSRSGVGGGAKERGRAGGAARPLPVLLQTLATASAAHGLMMRAIRSEDCRPCQQSAPPPRSRARWLGERLAPSSTQPCIVIWSRLHRYIYLSLLLPLRSHLAAARFGKQPDTPLHFRPRPCRARRSQRCLRPRGARLRCRAPQRRVRPPRCCQPCSCLSPASLVDSPSPPLPAPAEPPPPPQTCPGPTLPRPPSWRCSPARSASRCGRRARRGATRWTPASPAWSSDC